MSVRALATALVAWFGVGAASAAEPVRRDLGDVPRASGPIVVDGRLDDAAWTGAHVLPLDIETDPSVNTPAPVRTEVLLAYDDRRLYVAFRAEDPEPARIRAQLADRDSDAVFNGDLVGVILDPFHDGRIGVAFLANPLGVQVDLVLNDVTASEDLSWDAIWSSAGRITAGGFEVEIAIPFSALRFKASDAPQTWGFDAFRWYPRDKAYRLATNKIDRDVACTVCQFGDLGGLQGIRPGTNLLITPTLVGRYTQSADEIAGDRPGTFAVDPGITARWGVTPSLTLGATVNPDFSHVEADAVQLDVNEQFALYYEEKRPFFLEGGEYFDTPLRAVHTRTIADAEGGLKLVGKAGGASIGALVVQDALTNVVAPGSQYSESFSLPTRSWGGAARWRQDVGARSAIGALFTGRTTADGYMNGVAGADGLVRLSDADRVRLQALGSLTSYGEPRPEAPGLPEGTLLGHAIQADYTHVGTLWAWDAAYTDVGQGFRADLGYLPRVDYREGTAGLTRYWLGDGWYSRLHAKARASGALQQDGTLLEGTARAQAGLEGLGQSYVALGGEARRRSYLGASFDQLAADVYVEARPGSAVSFSAAGGYGDDIDYTGARAATSAYASPAVDLYLGRHLQLGLANSTELLRVPAGPLYTAAAFQVRAVYQFDVRTFIRVVSQYVHTDYVPARYAVPVPEREDWLYDQILFSYKLNPQTVAFLGYSDSWDLVTGTQLDRTVFAKIGYAWQPGSLRGG